MNAASLNALNERLERKVTFRTFRPNIVISGCESFAEVRFIVYSNYLITNELIRFFSIYPVTIYYFESFLP